LNVLLQWASFGYLSLASKRLVFLKLKKGSTDLDPIILSKNGGHLLNYGQSKSSYIGHLPLL
jgi:hypothetical protein